MFRVYKPKNFIKVKAVQLTTENYKELAQLLLGRVKMLSDDDDRLGVEIPTFEGVKRFEIGQWIIRADDNSLTVMDNEDFERQYEVARNMAGKD